VLLNMNLFLALKELIGFVADYLGVDSGQLVQALKIDGTSDGSWMATASQGLICRLDLCKPFVSSILAIQAASWHP
jgi:hypothetical protein